jgi:hypothetical protein
VPPGLGWVVFKDRKVFNEDLVFCVNGSSGKFRQSNGKPVGKENEEPSLSWIWNQGLPVSSDAV